ncbi:MAG: hypothetical protein ACKO7B_07350 [Flavobacteriales bacterium]
MRFTLIISFLLFASSVLHSQKNVGLASVEIVSAVTQNTLGYNAGYYVEFKNNGTKEVDGLKWKADFYDNFGSKKGTKDGQWQSGNFISPIKVNETSKDLETVWVEGATKVFIRIVEVHWTDGTARKSK